MDPFVVSECCCGCSLRTGVLIISWVYLVLSSMLITSFMALLVSLMHDYLYPEIEPPVSVYVFVYFILCLSIATFIFSSLAIVGVHKNISKFVRLFKNFLIFVVSTAALLIGFGLLFKGPTHEEKTIITLTTLFGTALQIYFMFVIRSYQLSMEDNNPGLLANEYSNN